MSKLGDSVIHQWRLRLPPAGAWYADVTLQNGERPMGKVVITSADLALHGAVLRSDFDPGLRARAVVVGGIGWQSLVTSPISFQSDGGVRLSTVLSELSKRTGEPIEQPADNTIGSYYECVASRPGEPVRYIDVLDALTRDGHVAAWRVDPDGVTRFGPRTPAEVTARATVLRNDGALGITTYGLDNPASFLPGNTINGIPIGSVDLRESSGHIEADVTTTAAAAAPDIRELVRRMVANAFEDAIRTYTVASVHGDGRMDLAPPADAPHLPEMRNVDQWCMGGIKYKPSVGDEVIVGFGDKRKTRPMVIGFKLGAGPFPEIARKGDSVHVLLPPGVFSGTINGAPASGMVVFPSMSTQGSIEVGSTKLGAAT